MQTKHRFSCLNCPGVYEYYYWVPNWTCPNCSGNAVWHQKYTDDYDE